MMPQLTQQAGVLMGMALDDGSHAGPSFEYQPVNPGRMMPAPVPAVD
jgi:hypothetical protein